MKPDAARIIRDLAQRLGRDELRDFLQTYHGIRLTIPSMDGLADEARDLEVMEAYRTCPHETLVDFYRDEARRQGCSARTIERILRRCLRKAA